MHQQYLEFLHKTGLVGCVLYLSILGSGLIGLRHLLGCVQPNSTHSYLLNALLGAYLGVLVGNLSQPNLNYSLVGNTLFLMLGLILTRHGAAELVTSSQTSSQSTSAGSRSSSPNTMIPDAKAA